MGGRPLRSRRVTLYLAPTDQAPRTAVVAGRSVGGAARRNRAKRVIREAWKAVAPRLRESADVVLVARPQIEGATTTELIEEVEDVLTRAGVL
ncbi:MAG TPA: ribonuclease P protein component [Actinomycetota bacterium]